MNKFKSISFTRPQRVVNKITETLQLMNVQDDEIEVFLKMPLDDNGLCDLVESCYTEWVTSALEEIKE